MNGSKVLFRLTTAPASRRVGARLPVLQRHAAGVLCLLLSACATFSNDPRVRTPGTMMDDEGIEKVVEQAIREADAGFEGAHLVIVSYNRVVLLLGQVASDELKKQAGEVTAALPRVRRVHNEIDVGGPISYVARSNDGLLTTKVKSKLIGAKDVPGRKLKVQTENGVVYLMGMVTREEADRAVEVTKTAYGVQKIVRVFEYLD